MKHGVPRTIFLLLLTLVFTVGLTFATIELPHHVDRLLQHTVQTPGGDSHADDLARLKTELFMAHYHVRSIGYIGFSVLVGLIVLGFATTRTGLAALGAVGFMLPVFAQFAGVMFFLAGLGLLNTVWLPVLDVSYEIQHWGLIINAPNDALRWLLSLVGVHSRWPTILFFIGSGILIVLLGVYAWLAARMRGSGVADSWVYRISRHPQYLGWILWTYGTYLLLHLMRYPRRSWGIGASLPWLVSTMVIIAVAMVEELRMRTRYGDAYDAYRARAPFLIPVPRFVARAFAMPTRLLFGKTQPTRAREVLVVVSLYTVLLVGASAVFYAGGWQASLARFASPDTRRVTMKELVAQATAESNWRRQQQLVERLASFGEPAVPALIQLLEGPDVGLRVMAAQSLAEVPSEQAYPALIAALDDPDENVRMRANAALRSIGSPRALPYLAPLLDDSVVHVRLDVLQTMAALGSAVTVERAPEFLADSAWWVRRAGVTALGTLGSPDAIPILTGQVNDESPDVRREIVIALLRIGAPEARPVLQRMLADEDFEVRVYAAESLERIP